MKKFWIALFISALTLGQAPAWASICQERCMPQASLACVRACAKGAALLTQGGRLASLGSACGQVELRFAQATLGSTVVAGPELPVSKALAAPATAVAAESFFAVPACSQAPPCPAPAQAFLSVPSAQAPPALTLSV